MTRPATLLITLALSAAAFAGGLLIGADDAQAQGKILKEYDNPYIYDGVVRENPFNFDFKIESVTSRVASNGRPKLDLTTRVPADEIIKRWKAEYKRSGHIDDNWVIIGHLFLARQGHTAFTIAEANGPDQHLLEVYEEDGVTILRLDARIRGKRNAAYRRVWKNFSPAGMDDYSVYLKAL